MPTCSHFSSKLSKPQPKPYPAFRRLIDRSGLAAFFSAGFFPSIGNSISFCPAAALRGFQNRDVPLVCPSLQPSLELIGNAAQHVPTHRIKPPIRVEEANDALRLLEGLNKPVQEDAIKAAVMPTNAIPVVFVERVHERPPLPQLQQGTASHGTHSIAPRAEGISRAEPLASWL